MYNADAMFSAIERIGNCTIIYFHSVLLLFIISKILEVQFYFLMAN